MAYDEELANRIRTLVSGEDTTEKKMFGGLASLINGNMSVSASGQGGLLVRVEPDQTEALLTKPGTSAMAMGGRGPVNGWLRVEPAALDNEKVLAAWAKLGIAYARTLPPKT